jgi:hypothetical protein
MRGSSDSVPNAIMLRDVDDVGIRRLTLRKDFQEEIVSVDGQNVTMYTYDETDVWIVERPNIVDYVNANFTNLFELGLRQTNEKTEIESNEGQLQYLLQQGRLVGELKAIGQQITEIMLEVL